MSSMLFTFYTTKHTHCWPTRTPGSFPESCFSASWHYTSVAASTHPPFENFTFASAEFHNVSVSHSFSLQTSHSSSPSLQNTHCPSQFIIINKLDGSILLVWMNGWYETVLIQTPEESHQLSSYTWSELSQTSCTYRFLLGKWTIKCIKYSTVRLQGHFQKSHWKPSYRHRK